MNLTQDDPLHHFQQVGAVARQTLTILYEGLSAEGCALPQDRQDRLHTTLDHLGNIREGFIISLRTRAVRDASEMRALVRHILQDWSWLQEFGWRSGQEGDIEIPQAQLVAFAHSLIALSLLPGLPSSAVTFPLGRPTYADIPVPRTPGEVLERIEEMENVITEASLEPIARIGRESLRRTYGYFEVSAWLITSHLARFGNA
ncbi:MAG: hypothetical protein EXR62_07255 [Chloroflexi bacterium]|nr:hypothetical protein [Chloroflexota bacterium]